MVVTHHLPSYSLIAPEYLTSENAHMNRYYASHLDDFISEADVWVCGHSHNFATTQIGPYRVYLNPVGYYREKSTYDSTLEIPLPVKEIDLDEL